MTSKHKVFTAKAMATLRRMAPDHTPAEIAAEIGSTPWSVQATANRYGIGFGSNALVIDLGERARNALIAEATLRNMSAAKLAERLLTIIARDNLVLAVLGRHKPRRSKANGGER
jgi:hypothetical protein